MTESFDWRSATEQALHDYHNLEALKDAPLGSLQITKQMLPAVRTERPSEHRSAIAIQNPIDLGLGELKRFDPDLAELLDQRFRRRKTVKTLQHEIHLSKTVLYERQKQAITALTSVLIKLEAKSVVETSAKRQRLLALLPQPTYQKWLGDAADLAQVHRTLDEGRQSGPRTPLFITGIGGLGKTSLAREAIATWLQRVDYTFDRLLWTVVVQPPISLGVQLSGERKRHTLDQVLADLGAQLDVNVNALPGNQRKLRVIAQALRDTSALVVIDNVESPDEVVTALRVVDSLSPVAQILVTSRHQIQHTSGYTVTLRELSAENAHRLLALEAQRLRLSEIDQTVFERLYHILGGHPHALKLAIAQLEYLPVAQTLRGLEEHSVTAQALFQYIYDRAWSLLSSEARDLMLGLWLLPAAGASWDGLKVTLNYAGNAYADEDLQRFIQELTALNLVQTTQTRPLIYSLHRLTYNFLAYKLGFAGDGSAA